MLTPTPTAISSRFFQQQFFFAIFRFDIFFLSVFAAYLFLNLFAAEGGYALTVDHY
jgi:hypothetical protein